MNNPLRALLIQAVTLVLIVLIVAGNPGWPTAVVIMIILVTLIMVMGDVAHLLPQVLKAILSELRRWPTE